MKNGEIAFQIITRGIFSFFSNPSFQIINITKKTRKLTTCMQCCGFGMFIPDPNFFHPGYRVKKIPDPESGSASKNWSTVFLTQKIVSKLSEIWSGMLFRIWTPDPDLDLLPIPDPGSRGQKGTGSRGQKGTGSRGQKGTGSRIRNTACLYR